jgi:hypothetical protein
MMLKSILLLTTFLFLIIAPEPDAADIADITANLIVPQNHAVLMASEVNNPDLPKLHIPRTQIL